MYVYLDKCFWKQSCSVSPISASCVTDLSWLCHRSRLAGVLWLGLFYYWNCVCNARGCFKSLLLFVLFQFLYTAECSVPVSFRFLYHDYNVSWYYSLAKKSLLCKCAGAVIVRYPTEGCLLLKRNMKLYMKLKVVPFQCLVLLYKVTTRWGIRIYGLWLYSSDVQDVVGWECNVDHAVKGTDFGYQRAW